MQNGMNMKLEPRQIGTFSPTARGESGSHKRKTTKLIKNPTEFSKDQGCAIAVVDAEKERDV